jgi:hypothetical protein
VVAALGRGHVGVLAQLDVALGAEDEQPPVAPGVEPVRREPVDAHVTCAAVAGHDHVAEVFELRVVRVIDVAGLRGDHVRRRAVGVVEELLAWCEPMSQRMPP